MFTQQANKIRSRHKKKRKKLVLVFDEDCRREFLTGFHKRKVQRKNRAKEELEKQLKAERKRIKAEAKEQYKKLLLAQKPIPELEDLLSEEIDMGTHSVTVTELSAADLARKNNLIGANEGQYSEKEKDISQSDEDSQNELEGTEFTTKVGNKSIKQNPVLNCKDIKKKIKKQATLNVQKSMAFQKKVHLEKIKNKKLQKRQEKMKKLRKKSKKDKHKRN